MKMKTRTIPLLTMAMLIVLCAASGARANEEKLASAKSLYEAASYEAALSELNAIDTTELVDDVDIYKALCLLGLGRVRDAEQALQLVVTRKPLLVLSDADYSPRVVALFREVRKKALPAAAQQLYMDARTDYDSKKYDTAAAGFKQALQIIAEIGPDSQTATLADLKELSSGFATLADAKIAAQAPPLPRAPTPASAAVASAAVIGPAFYTLADLDVTPPVVVAQQIPSWTFTTGYAPNRVFSGTLEVLIDENGKVETATLAERVWPPYDLVLLQAAKRWQYQPAVREGKPVKFKRTLAISIDPGAPRPR
jgi:tetratricopeptide (TPR) repeat protein